MASGPYRLLWTMPYVNSNAITSRPELWPRAHDRIQSSAFSIQQFTSVHSVSNNLQLKNATGCSAYSRTAPTYVSEASIRRMKGRSSLGKCSIGGMTKASCSQLNADCSAKKQCQIVPLQSKSDKGVASHAK